MYNLRTILAVGALMAFGATVTPAKADILTYDWTLAPAPGVTSGGLTYTGSGMLTVDTTKTKTVGKVVGDLVTSFTGTLDGTSVALAASSSFTGLETPDDYLFPTGNSKLESSSVANSFTAGLGLTSSASGNVLLISQNQPNSKTSDSNGYQELTAGGSSLGEGNFTVTLAPVPLPSSVWMMILGLGGLGFAVKRTGRQIADVA